MFLKLHIPFKKQKPALTLWDGDGTNCDAKKTSRNYEKPSRLLKQICHQSQPTATEPEPKKDKVTSHMV